MKNSKYKFDYYEKVNSDLKIIEDDYGNLKIIDHASLSEIPYTDIYKDSDFSYSTQSNDLIQRFNFFNEKSRKKKFGHL